MLNSASAPVTSASIRFSASFRKARKSSVEVADGPSVRDLERTAPDAHGIFCQLNLRATGRRSRAKIVRVEEEAKHFGVGNKVVKQLQSFLNKVDAKPRDAGDISARPVETGDNTQLHGVGAHKEHMLSLKAALANSTKSP